MHQIEVKLPKEKEPQRRNVKVIENEKKDVGEIKKVEEQLQNLINNLNQFIKTHHPSKKKQNDSGKVQGQSIDLYHR